MIEQAMQLRPVPAPTGRRRRTVRHLS
jgi:hypothetical protein